MTEQVETQRARGVWRSWPVYLGLAAVVLFSDGEELGLLGARAFARHHPWMADVRLVLNFEARGTRGPSILFETGPGTGPLMTDFATTAPHPLAFSYGYDVYRRLPNDTDFTVFREAGKSGFNVDRTYGLPDIPGASYGPRPPVTMPNPSLPTDVTLVRKTYVF